MNNYEYEATKNVYAFLKSEYNKVVAKADKEYDKLNQNYITFKGERCYTEEDIMNIYESDGCTCSESDKAIEKLESKREKKTSDKLKVLIEEEKILERLKDSYADDIYEYEHHDEIIEYLEQQVRESEDEQ